MRVRRALIVALTASFLLVSGCTTPGGCGAPVPDVKGQTPEQARETLTDAGFKPGAITYDEFANGAPGAVVEQDPEAGTRLQEGSIVNLMVAGPEPETVPDIVGLTTDSASSALAAFGLTLGDVSERHSATVAAGEIIRQDPAAGTQVAGESSVNVVVSSGPEAVAPPKKSAEPSKVTVPAVKGLKLAVAEQKIEAAGLRWEHELGPGDGMTDEGFVYKQVPAAGATVDAGSVVRLVTWEGP